MNITIIPLTFDGVMVSLLFKDAFHIKDALKVWPKDGLFLPSSGQVMEAALDCVMFYVKESLFLKGASKIWVLSPSLQEGTNPDLSDILANVESALEGKTVKASNSERLAIHVAVN